MSTNVNLDTSETINMFDIVWSMPFLWDTNPKPQTHHITGVSTSAAIANEEPKKTDRWGNWEYW